jgi:DNA polymerase-3 subunit delta'
MAAAMTELGAGQQPAERDLVRALADGAPGFAAFLSAAGAGPLYQDLLALLGQLPRLNLSTQIALAERLARQPIETGTELFTTLMTLLLQRLVRSASGSVTSLDQERRAFDIMRHALTDADWVDLWSSLRDQFQRADALNLDKKQFVLNAFYSIESAASRRANARG